METFNNRVLVIDDDPGLRDAYRDIFGDRSTTSATVMRGARLFDEQADQCRAPRSDGYRLTVAEDGERGLLAVERATAAQAPYAVVFIDMKMPGMDGTETATRIGAADPLAKLVIVTAYSEYSPEQIICSVGREDIFYVRKPFAPEEIRQFARALTAQWNLEREAERMARQLAAARELELDTAGRIQRMLLLGETPPRLTGIDVGHLTIASQKVDGDFYDFLQPGDGLFDVVIGDVMGKGVAAALIGAAVKGHIVRSHLGIADAGAQAPPSEVVAATHASVIRRLIDLETFVTLCYTRFDLHRQKAVFIDCGHVRTIYVDGQSGSIDLLSGENLPLGVLAEERFVQTTKAFKPGDLFFFYSDGITEAGAADGEMLGEERLAQIVKDVSGRPPAEVVAHVKHAVTAFAGSAAFADDFTAIAVRILSPLAQR